MDLEDLLLAYEVFGDLQDAEEQADGVRQILTKNDAFLLCEAHFIKKFGASKDLARMEHVLKETDTHPDSVRKYDKRLDELDELKQLDKRERDSISADLDDMRNQRNDHLTMINTHFNQMQQREKDIGSGVINTKTGKQLPDKVLDRLLKRQRSKWDEVAGLRLSYIKIRNKVAEKKEALHALDFVGDNLHLIDYEQLKIENQSHIDKVEERDEELTKLRIKCSETLQCLAHIREKSAACQIDMQTLNERLTEVDDELTECRENLNNLKQQRDMCRSTTRQLIEDAGLLTQPKLLLDMEDSISEIQMQTKRLESLKNEYATIQNKLAAIKLNMSKVTPNVHKAESTKIETSNKVKHYRGRPTLICPELSTDLHDLQNIHPT